LVERAGDLRDPIFRTQILNGYHNETAVTQKYIFPLFSNSFRHQRLQSLSPYLLCSDENETSFNSNPKSCSILRLFIIYHPSQQKLLQLISVYALIMEGKME
jgi:hypothetical protein